ncbi:MAG: hypothetical protein QNJ97_15780 [Myxococcota bacterium]|nr:hypothetical protein [Myxococcota bacterium]
MKRITHGLLLSVALVGFSGLALANEFTDVIDAFDHEIQDPFDINLLVGYERFQRSATIAREWFDDDPPNWEYYNYKKMYKYKRVSHILNMELEVGVFRDLSFKFRLPLVLNDTRELTKHSDWDGSEWIDENGESIAAPPLLPSSFSSPERSGVDYLAFGLWWGILDQGRDDTKPNWTLYAEGRFSVGATLKASEADEERGGISRGVNELCFGTRLSRRYGILDPYFGIEALIGWAKTGTDYLIEGNKDGQLNKMPPVVGTLDFGIEIIPWELPERDVKIAAILGAQGKYHSEGRDYTPMFDILGTENHFTNNALDYDFNNDGTIDLLARDAEETWSGMTDVENYAAFVGKLMIMAQPAKYVKFHIGFLLGHETEHFITKTDQCRSENMGDDDICEIYNWGYRPELDKPGNRFRAQKTLLWTFLLDAVAMF